MLRALLYDFDGLILDTETPEVTAWREMFAGLGLDFPDWIWMQMIGQSSASNTEVPWTYLLEKGVAFDREALEISNRERRRELIAAKDPMPGVVQSLERAREAALRLVVVSSSRRSWVEGHLDRLGLLSEFEFIVCGHEGLPSKPAPDLYLSALAKLKLDASECLAIEDSPNGVRAALGAGLRVLCVPNELTRQLDTSAATASLASLEQFDAKLLRSLALNEN